MEMLRALGVKIKKTISMNTWLFYTNLMQEWARENRITPRHLDMALFAMHRDKLDKENRNLYK